MSEITQPDLPPEGQFSEIEQLFIEESPPGLWPENQDSNFGQVRRIITIPMQEASDEMTTLNAEQFVETSVEDLHLHEAEAGLPTGNVNKSIEQRRADLKTRKKKGAFTHLRRNEIIQAFIEATFGSSLQFSVDGIPLDASGEPLYSDATGNYADLFRIYEDVRDFSYEVWIRDDVDPDLVGLERELRRITPAGISFTIVEKAAADLLSYEFAVRNKQPVWYSRFSGNANDASGYGNNGSLVSAPVAVASPGLLHASVAGGSAAYDFDGVDDRVTVPHAAQLNVGDHFSVEAWVNIDALPGAGDNYRIMSKSTALDVLISAGGIVQLWSGAAEVVRSNMALVPGTTYHIVVTKRGATAKVFIDGVDVSVAGTPFTFLDNTSTLFVAGIATRELNGKMDEPALYNYALTPAEILDNYNTGKFIP